MPLYSRDFEKLGAFYLGRPYDPVAKQAVDAPLLYDSRDLTTHAVCVGMTGSGKTGLCLALLEEAALDGIPAIIIDPKGDLGNLLLTFPELRKEDFRPWINEEDAARKGLEPDAYAVQQAEMWKAGLASWGETPERIQMLREKTDMVIYTPGSASGVPVNVLASFAAPEDVTDDEALTDRVQTAAGSLLGLLQIDADPVKSRECILLSAIFSHEWKEGRDLSLSTLIERIQTPPFEKVGVLDLETFYPAKDRFALVMALNNVLAAPGFSAWQQGEALDIGKSLYTKDGRPRLAIYSIAHLSDSERMFFVSLLLNEIVAWTRAQSGTTSLRAIVYMDEIFGYMPPTSNPPSKLPMLTLLKQARAFGVGMVLATQNPVDLDYKALSNAGTWFIGRLQTERDKARVLDGLQSADATGKFDRRKMEATLGSLGNRIFLMNNVHDDGPVVFETRWVMSYLRGPLTRDQIKMLTPVSQVALAAEASRSEAPRPALPPAIPQVFLPGPVSDIVYRPRLLGLADVKFTDSKLGVDETRKLMLSATIPEGMEEVDWSTAEALTLSIGNLRKTPSVEARFEALPAGCASAKNYAVWEKQFAGWIASGHTLELFRCPSLKMASQVGETKGDFQARISLAAREQKDEQLEELRKKYAPKLAALQARRARAEAAVERQKEQASHARMQTVISIGSTLLGAFLGRKAISASTLGKATTAARGVGRSVKEGADVAQSEQSVASIDQQLAELDAEFQAASAALSATEPEVEVLKVRPSRTGTSVRLLALAWVPV